MRKINLANIEKAVIDLRLKRKKDIALAAELSLSTIQRIWAFDPQVTDEKLEQLRVFLKLPRHQFYEDEDLPTTASAPKVIHENNDYHVPLLGKIAATPYRLPAMTAANRFVLGTRADRGAFALELDGDSMEPEFRHGDIIFCWPENVALTPFADTPDEDTFVPFEVVSRFHNKNCVILHNGDSSFKQLHITRGRGIAYSVDIVSLNKAYPVTHVKQGHEFFVQGVCYRSQHEH